MLNLQPGPTTHAHRVLVAPSYTTSLASRPCNRCHHHAWPPHNRKHDARDRGEGLAFLVPGSHVSSRTRPVHGVVPVPSGAMELPGNVMVSVEALGIRAAIVGRVGGGEEEDGAMTLDSYLLPFVIRL